MSYYGLGLGYGCCNPCGLQCYYPTLVDGCPVNIQCGAIIPEPCGPLGPCYGGVSVPAHGCGKNKCCQSTTNGCGLVQKKVKSQWLKPGLAATHCGCGCC